jgi:hypothetical protein
MPIDQFTRAYYAMNKVLDEVSRSVSLGQRATVVLLILSDADKGQMRTKELVATFQGWFVSGENTAAKDVSIAKGELFDKDLIMARHGIRNVELTEQGAQLATELIAKIEAALENLVDGHRDLVLIQQALSTMKPKPPAKALSSVGVKKKPMDTAGGANSPGPRKTAR